MLGVISYMVRHSCSESQMDDLITLLKCLIPSPNHVKRTFKNLKKAFTDDVALKAVDYCQTCAAIFPMDDPLSYKCPTPNCKT